MSGISPNLLKLLLNIFPGLKVILEVIVLSLDEKAKAKSVARLIGKLNLSQEQDDDFQEDIKNSRHGWEKNISLILFRGQKK